MKILQIKTQKRKKLLSTYNQKEVLRELFSNELKDKILINKISPDKIELCVNEEVLNTLLDKILNLQLNNNLKLENEKITIKEIKILESLEEKILGNRLAIILKSPVTFKIGNNFLESFSIYYIFQLLAKKYNIFFTEDKIFLDKEELKKIKILRDNIQKEVLVEEREKVNVFLGEIEIDFSLVKEEEQEKYKKILLFAHKNGMGYRHKKHYGLIEVTEII